MKIFIKSAFPILITFLFFSFPTLNSCNKQTDVGKVEFYLLESFDTLPESNKIDIQGAVKKAEPFINYSEIISYNKSNYTFKLSDSALKTLKSEAYSLRGLGFVLVANEEIIYSGYFWPSISSASCDWFTIDPLYYGNNKITVKKGYPNESFYHHSEDNRNDKTILDILERDGKLLD